MSLNGVPLILSGVIVCSQLFDLVIFHFWRQKEPYILFHVALAYTSLLVGVDGAVTPLVRMLPWKEPVVSFIFINIFFRGYEFFHTLALMTLLFISVDRWVSVEFAVEYRARISTSTVRLFIALTWILTATLTLPGIILYWPNLEAACDKVVRDTDHSAGRPVWKIFTGPVILCLLLLSQTRIFIIAVNAKLRQLVAKARSPTATGPSPQVIVRIVWSSLRASMIILLFAVLSEAPYLLRVERWVTSPTVVRMVFMLPAVQHMYSPLVYLLFFPPFRDVLRRGCQRLFGGNRRSQHAATAPHKQGPGNVVSIGMVDLTADGRRGTLNGGVYTVSMIAQPSNNMP
ncbi:hypothetical protein BV898_13178 [Hypsibius exemplaris]|uniref:G-protein coupled receptors family 1 profile domain-containing protein n=1 Tax=Hypsibius exemplaris TaxID=2072580 RepID=A0A1W0WBF2_HYPEX|nr:hypothetical protein BV898_13178 [Hypsibius exemplaris]